MEETNMEEPKAQSQSLAIPIAIIVGFGLIAVAIFFSGGGGGAGSGGNNVADNTAGGQGDSPEAATSSINPVTEDDHIRGNPNAPIVIVEYSDYDCPFCKNFHDTMNQIMDEYGADGRVAWVYRHFPLEQLHPNAPQISQASECVAKLGGNDAFWTFSDLVFSGRESNEPTNMVLLPDYVTTVGVEIEDFNTCMDSGETQPLVEEDFTNAIAIGGRGTPHSIVMVGDQQGVINGAQPYEVVKGIVDNLLGQIDGQ